MNDEVSIADAYSGASLLEGGSRGGKACYGTDDIGVHGEGGFGGGGGGCKTGGMLSTRSCFSRIRKMILTDVCTSDKACFFTHLKLNKIDSFDRILCILDSISLTDFID